MTKNKKLMESYQNSLEVLKLVNKAYQLPLYPQVAAHLYDAIAALKIIIKETKEKL